MKRALLQAFGLFLALLALVAPLTLTAAAPAAARSFTTVVSLAEVTTLCRHGGIPGAPSHRFPACRFCLIGHAAPGSTGLVTASPVLPEPSTIHLARVMMLRPTIVSPPRLVTAALPRGPPSPV